MDAIHKSYLPAAGSDLALPLYDPLVKLLGGDKVRAELLAAADLQPKQRVLDIGCGTGTFLALLKRQHPQVDATGLDPDPKALARAQRKAQRAAAVVCFDRGYADALPYPDATFDRVFSSFMFHHLAAEDRERTLREVLRVLKPGGTLHLLDFIEDESHHGLMHLFHRSHRLKDNSQRRMTELLTRAGFSETQVVAAKPLLFGMLPTCSFCAQAPVSSPWPR